RRFGIQIGRRLGFLDRALFPSFSTCFAPQRVRCPRCNGYGRSAMLEASFFGVSGTRINWRGKPYRPFLSRGKEIFCLSRVEVELDRSPTGIRLVVRFRERAWASMNKEAAM